jgi:hypothetical protein
MSDIVRVLVGERKNDKFTYFWAEFEGEKVSHYEDEKGVNHTLYKCTAFNFEAYRVHVSDETNSKEPTYRLEPYTKDSHISGMNPEYTRAYDRREIAATYPRFIKNMSPRPDDVYPIDPAAS